MTATLLKHVAVKNDESNTVDSNNCSELMEYILCSCINGDASVVNVLITTTEPSVLAFVSLSALYETKIPKISVNRTTNR